MEEIQVSRQMPNSLEAEQSVIGSMLQDQDAIVAAMDILTREDFYHQQYGALFAAITEIYGAGEPVDPVLIQNRLREMSMSPEIASLSFLADLVAAVPVSVNIRSYANIVKEKAVLRSLIRTNQALENLAFAQEESADAILEKAEKDIFSLVKNRAAGDTVPIRQIVMNSLDAIERASKQHGTVTGVPTGFLDLDARTAGLQPSDLILVAARPSMGKTAFVLNIAQYVAFHEHMCAAIFSLEMSKEQLVNRLLAMESRVEATKIRTGDLQDSEWEQLIEGAGTVGASKLIIDDTPGISISELRSKCRKFQLEHPDLSIVMVDYLQLMAQGGKTESHQLEIAEISRSLKALARELRVPVVALSQLSRAVEQRPDHRPMLSDLRDSGAIEQDADVVMFIYRDDYYHPDTERKGISEIIIAKQRNGPIGTEYLAWIPEFTKFANLERHFEN